MNTNLMNTRLIRTPFQAQVWRTRKYVDEARARMSLADYWFMLGFWLALFYVADPFSLRLEKIGLTKHLPLMISLSGAIIINIGTKIFVSDLSRLYDRYKRRYWEVLKAALPLALMGGWIVLGSLYARKHEGIGNSFITVGLYMLFALVTARVVMLSAARETMVKSFIYFAILASLFMTLKMAIMHDDHSSPYHELEFLIIPLMVFFALQPGKVWPTLMTLFFVIAGLLFRKNTGFIVLALTLIYLWLAEWRFRFRESVTFRFWTLFWMVIVIIAGLALAGYLAYQRGEIMPSGNPGYRMHTYEQAWERFLESPFYGTSFTGAGTEKFTGFQILVARGNLPTHSDVLDFLAQGGVLAIFLWLWAYVRVGRFSYRHVLSKRRRDQMSIAGHTFACMSLMSIAVYAFNPILLQPAKSLLLWGIFGMLLGIGLHRQRQELDGDGASEADRTDEPAAPRKNRLYRLKHSRT